uniref:Transposase MuDR plant domain-containing protein n=1 Tax=Cucumis melo TaxID=3656 RepID=A0A9I9EFI7_CUCME
IEEENGRISSEIFTQIDWDIRNFVCEQGTTLANRDESVDTSCLIQKGMLFDCKKNLQLAVKKYRVTQHYEIVVVESNQNIWSVRYKQWSNGCNWRLRGNTRKSHELFEISQLEEE